MKENEIKEEKQGLMCRIKEHATPGKIVAAVVTGLALVGGIILAVHGKDEPEYIQCGTAEEYETPSMEEPLEEA